MLITKSSAIPININYKQDRQQFNFLYKFYVYTALHEQKGI